MQLNVGVPQGVLAPFETIFLIFHTSMLPDLLVMLPVEFLQLRPTNMDRSLLESLESAIVLHEKHTKINYNVVVANVRNVLNVRGNTRLYNVSLRFPIFGTFNLCNQQKFIIILFHVYKATTTFRNVRDSSYVGLVHLRRMGLRKQCV